MTSLIVNLQFEAFSFENCFARRFAEHVGVLNLKSLFGEDEGIFDSMTFDLSVGTNSN